MLLAASPLVDGVTGRHFEDNRESAPVEGCPDAGRTGVASWSVDPAADRLWDYALPVIQEATVAG